jgi:hypothetical protein
MQSLLAVKFIFKSVCNWKCKLFQLKCNYTFGYKLDWSVNVGARNWFVLNCPGLITRSLWSWPYGAETCKQFYPMNVACSLWMSRVILYATLILIWAETFGDSLGAICICCQIRCSSDGDKAFAAVCWNWNAQVITSICNYFRDISPHESVL